ncbi:VWA domain-containing protein [Gordonia amarae]|uniref:VWFA domain-containing protein n=2 Tax=Gordonia amarae TaxID=36821 RepID=G7GNA7_9ACTN|nr:DUF5682 family protein [Gordonia amarae]MCS3877136.1 hypothetical protein [Gordonia amarae]QHN15927.1 VWA domain-containing protein [Gordonia amarae]QHN20495.1 VWA domain-containing protein [Gordonia amarae]QHN38126.1 VWA domain-containing protein [Gordonia amarae]GAB05082.1 hypothetical protein GOAMR_26_00560 [Gordonia amarae NBRC 15530]
MTGDPGVAVTAAVAALAGQRDPLLIGVRHHSPTLARVLPRLLEAAAPRVLAVELPAEAAGWVRWIGHPDTVPPVAFALADPGTDALSFYPLAAFSPEYVAVRWAHEHGVPVECIDLPAAVSRDVTPSSVASAPRPGVADALADLLGAQASVDSWDLLVESRGAGADPEAVRVAALAAGWALRADHRPDEDAENELREARMRTCLRAFDPGVVAVVGAFHAPALTTGMLADPAVEAADELLLQRFPADRNPVASLVPYGSAELDTRSGYPAGIADPAWQAAVLAHGDSPTELRAAATAALTDIGIEVRRRGHPCGTGEIAEAVRVAADLATLRGLPAPGRRELLEAMTGVYAQGDVFGRGRVVAGAAQRVLVGSERGQLAPGTPRSGLADDLDRRLAALRLPAAATELRLEPLRGNLDADREIFLRQLLAAGIAYGKPTAGTGAGGARTVGSRWSVAVTSATHASTEAAALFGVTVPQVAAARLRHTMRRDGDRPETAALVLRRALHCALDDLAAELITAVRRRFPHEAGLAELTETIALCDETLTGQFAGALDDGIAALRESLTGLRAELVPPVIRELDGLAGATDTGDAALLADTYRTLYRTSGDGPLRLRHTIIGFADGAASPLIQGAASALLAVGEDGRDLRPQVESLISGATDTERRDRLTGYVRGMLTAVPHLLSTAPEVFGAFHDVIAGLPDAGFVARLPTLRAAFDGLAPEVRERLLTETERATGVSSRRSGIDPELVAGWADDDQRAFDRLRALGLADAAFTPGVRWQLVLGRRRGGPNTAVQLGRSLDRLYGAPSTRIEAGLGIGGDEAPYPTVREWSADLAELFGADVRDDVLGAAAARGDAAAALALSPGTVRPSVELLTTMLSLSGGLPESALAGLRPLVRRCVDDLTKALATRLQPALRGLRTARPTRRNTRILDARRTIAANLSRVYRDAEGRNRVIAADTVFSERALRQPDWHLIIVVDVSGSMEPSTVFAALTAAILAGVPSLSVTFLAFSTEVVDLSEHVDDPLALLMEIRVGGGTSIQAGLAAATDRVRVPKRTLLVLISDFEEGGSTAPMIAAITHLAGSGVSMLGCAALDDTGVARYHVGTATAAAAAGMPVSAVSPLRLAEWVAETITGPRS